MAEEPQVMSIQQRIAALKQAQAADAAPSPVLPSQQHPRPSAPRTNSINNPPANAHGSVSERSSIGNQPAPASQPATVLPPPTPTQSSAGQKKTPPPLPSRKTSTQQLRPPPSYAPALPPRRPSQDPSTRRNSQESVASDISRSTTTSAGRTAESNGSGRIRAPAWGAQLPALPPKRQQPQPPPRRPSSSSSSAKNGSHLSSPPPLPSRRPSNSSLRTNGSASETPPPLPSRSPNPNNDASSNQPQGRKLPPPPPTNAALGRIQDSGFCNKTPELPSRSASGTPQANGTPPPVPLATRPDLSKIQATKPQFNGTSGYSNPTPAAGACLVCRDFSAPDAHAAQHPRQSLPTHDPAWLAHELTAPFPSHTDKARAIFTWLHHNVEYDVHSFFNGCVKPSTPAGTISSGLAVCEGYAGLFTALATHAGMQSVVISGHGKGFGFNGPPPGGRLPPFSAGHAWNAVQIDNGHWKLIDACWGAGVVQGAGQPYKKLFSPTKFTMSNDEFGLEHFPSNKSQFYRDDGRPEISWEEYLLGNPHSPFGGGKPNTFVDLGKHGIGERTFRPAAPKISVSHAHPIRFQFSLRCAHWTPEKHNKAPPGLFFLMTHGVDGRKDENLVFNYVRGSTPGGGGDLWYVDVADPRSLGAPGQTLPVAVLNTFGDRQDARGVTAEEYRARVGRVGMSWAFVAQWELTA